MAEAKKPSKKAELVAEAKKLKLSVNEKNTIVQLETAIAEAKAAKEAIIKTNELLEDTKIVEEIIDTELEDELEQDVKLAKAGKRSSKAQKEAEDKAAKEERKASEDHEPVKTRPVIKVRSKVERKGKKYRAAAELVDNNKVYSLKDAVETTIKTSTAKFDATIELHVRLGVDPRHADQNIRATLVLPEGTGKSVKVAVFAEADDVSKAKTAGADISGNEEFLQQLDKGIIDFDVLIATPAVMPKLGKYARVLGPKGLMPSPKSGTVTTDIAKAVKEAKAGKVEFRVDSNGIVHLGVGKVSFGADRIVKNVQVVLSSIKSAKPASVKGNYLVNIYLSSTMGPSVKLDSADF